jgi:2-methylcitrate dehydratase PrpD
LAIDSLHNINKPLHKIKAIPVHAIPSGHSLKIATPQKTAKIRATYSIGAIIAASLNR